MGDGAIDPPHFEGFQPFYGCAQILGLHVKGKEMPPLQAHILKRRILYHHAGILRHGMAEDPHQMVQIVLLFHWCIRSFWGYSPVVLPLRAAARNAYARLFPRSCAGGKGLRPYLRFFRCCSIQAVISASRRTRALGWPLLLSSWFSPINRHIESF